MERLKKKRNCLKKKEETPQQNKVLEVFSKYGKTPKKTETPRITETPQQKKTETSQQNKV